MNTQGGARLQVERGGLPEEYARQVREGRRVSTAGLPSDCLADTPATFCKGDENACSATITNCTAHHRGPEAIFVQCKAKYSIAQFLQKERATWHITDWG